MLRGCRFSEDQDGLGWNIRMRISWAAHPLTLPRPLAQKLPVLSQALAGERPLCCSPRFPPGTSGSGGVWMAPSGWWALEESMGPELVRACPLHLDVCPTELLAGGMGVPCTPHDSPLLSPQCMRLVFAQETPSACSDARGSAGSHVGFLRRVGIGRRGNNRQLLGGESWPSSPPTDPTATVTAPQGVPWAALTSLPESIPAAVASCLSWLCRRSQPQLSPRGTE